MKYKIGTNPKSRNGFQKGNSLGKKHKGKPRPYAKTLPQIIKKGQRLSKKTEFKKGFTPWNKGLKGYNAGAMNNRWKGGITPINASIRTSTEYKLWRKSVFERDNYACIWGGKAHGTKLHADHIKPFSLFPELRFSIDNGRTLCVPCHKLTDTFAGKVFKYVQ